MSSLINTSEIFTTLHEKLDELHTVIKAIIAETDHNEPIENHNPFEAFANPNNAGIRGYYYM